MPDFFPSMTGRFCVIYHLMMSLREEKAIFRIQNCIFVTSLN